MYYYAEFDFLYAVFVLLKLTCLHTYLFQLNT